MTRKITRVSSLIGQMTVENLNAVLVERVLHWTTGPNRFVTGNRCWIPRNRFRPTDRMQDAYRLLVAAEPTEYRMGGTKGKACWASVRIGDTLGEASAASPALAICIAIAKALRIDVGEVAQ